MVYPEGILHSIMSVMGVEAGKNMALELCKRFILETDDATEAVRVEAYLTRAFSVDEPLLLSGPPAGLRPRRCVLDVCCHPFCEDETNPQFLKKIVDPSTRQDFKQHHLVQVLRSSLEALGLLSNKKGIVLSLSGWVDSMVTCCLLSLLQDPSHMHMSI